MFRSINKGYLVNPYLLRIIFMAVLILAAIVWVAGMPLIQQDIDYHSFADASYHLNLPNASNVLSNVGFVVAGIIGLKRLSELPNSPAIFRWRFFFGSIVVVGLGSSYYHWWPSNDSLFWDRLPMTLGFASLTACLFAERMGERAGSRLFIPLVLAGAASVVYWWATEKAGAGDLRPYILVQFLPMALAPLLITLFPKGAAWDRPYWILLVGYGIAKGFEWQDIAVYEWTYHIVSGHTLKHVVAATAIALFRPLITPLKRSHRR